MKKIDLLEVIYSLNYGGAERLALTICNNLDPKYFSPKMCGLYGENGPLTESVIKSQIPYFNLKGERLGKSAFLKEIFSLIKRENVSLVHVHGFYQLLQCFLPAKLAGVRIVYTEHANFGIKRFRRYTVLASILPHFVDGMTTVSNHLKDYFVGTHGVSSAKIKVIYNGVDPNKFKVHGSPERANNSVVHIGTVGRLSEPKDHKTLLRALKIIHEIRDDFHLTIVGDGELRPVLEETLRELEIENHVSLLGSRDNIPQILSAFDIFVLSSKREGFPIAILEAMACERAVIATRVGGVPEVITNGENGILVPPENPEALAKKILELSGDLSFRERLVKQARKTIEEQFPLNKTIQSYQDLFLGLMN